MDMEDFEKWVYREYNINLSAYKSNQLHRRINNLMSRVGITSIDDYIKLLKKDVTQKNKFLDYITINVTEFFRNPEMFQDLANKMIEELECKIKPIKIWSAACSNGAEAYSIAMILNNISPNIRHTIIATDIDENILRKAKSGQYTEYDVKKLKPEYLAKYFTKKDNVYCLDQSIKNKVKFKKHDLILDQYENNFDLILCRNVVIYFKSDIKDSIYKRFSNSLKKGGLLFVGATESIYEYKKFNFEKSSTFIYRKI